jgi:DNA-binding transcriptional LysR family regulator
MNTKIDKTDLNMKKSKKRTPYKKSFTRDLFSGSLRDLRIADVDLFVATAHLKNLGKAAALHHLSQSAASSAIHRVEQAFGRPLCTHERRQWQLTKEGQLLLPRVENWLRTLRETVATQETSPIRLATTHAIARVCISSVLALESVDLKLMRPDSAYGAILRDEADIALVLDNAPWEGVVATEIGKGKFQLYSTQKTAPQGAVLLPEDQIEVLTLQQRWQQLHGQPLAVKARLPSWSLIADICSSSAEIGFLPDFLAQQAGLHPVAWQPSPSRYRILALYRNTTPAFQERLDKLLGQWSSILTQP